tara:strand:- start:321 stop:548 length:228 start_codon:yes stop_codon:yes gene_type:complete
MDIKTIGQMNKYVKSLKYLVIFPDKTSKFYKSLRKISDDISVDYSTISRKLTEENPCICVSKNSNYVFSIRKLEG